MAEIDKVMDAIEADPDGYHYIHGSVFDINDDRIIDRLIRAQEAGVEVKLLSSGHHMTPDKHWETGYRRLQEADIEVIGVQREGSCASNHTKFANFDGKVAVTGSYNWETRSAEENCENLMVIRSPEVAAIYEDMYQAIKGGPQIDRPIDPTSKLKIYYSQQHNVPAVLYDEIEKAQESVVVSMFTLRGLPFVDEDSKKKDVLDALARAQARGVKVFALLEENNADAGEYYGNITPNDLTDERLAEKGIEVVKIHTDYHNNKYAAMHHKFAVIDARTVMTGAYNWYSGSQRSDDDLVVLRDETVAKTYLGEVTNLRRHYDPTFDPESVSNTKVRLQVKHPGTKPGDQVFVVGDIPELGGWDPDQAIPLDAAA